MQPYEAKPISSGLYSEWTQRVFNLTPHAVKIRLDDESVISIPPCGEVVRAEMSVAHLVDSDGGPIVISSAVPLVAASFGAVDVPSIVRLRSKPGDVYIVSTLAADALEAAEWRGLVWGAQVAVPDSGPTATRNAEGQIVGVARLIMRLHCEPRSLVNFIDHGEPVVMINSRTGDQAENPYGRI